MPVSAIGSDDLDWAVQVLRQRRERLVEHAPVFWRPAVDATSRHRAFLAYLLAETGTRMLRTDTSVLLAVPGRDGWLVDDFHVPGSDWAARDGGELWRTLDGELDGEPVRLVCPTVEPERAAFAMAAGLSIAESWWLLELTGVTGGEGGVRIALPGAEALTVVAPPVYDPLGPVLYVSTVKDSRIALESAVERAHELGCPAVVVNHTAGDHELAGHLSAAGFRQHCDYFTGVIGSI